MFWSRCCRFGISLLGMALLMPSPAWSQTAYVPLPWLAAQVGVGGPGAVKLALSCSYWDGESTVNCLPSENPTQFEFASGEPISINDDQFQLSMEVVSSVDGNSWTYGYRNLVLTTAPIREEGQIIQPGDLTFFSLSLRFDVTASFDVPFDGMNPITPIFFSPGLIADDEEDQSAILGAGVDGDPYAAGDQITTREGMYATWSLYVDADFFSGGMIYSVDKDTYGTCSQSGVRDLDFSDCLGQYSLYTVELEELACNGGCDDGNFCNGIEQCVDEVCVAGASPCAEGVICDEDMDSCETCGIADTDNDGVKDACDNCILVANGPANSQFGNQTDTDADGYGNACDGDFDQKLPIVGLPDLTQMRLALGKFRLGNDCPQDNGAPGGACDEFDVNGDGLPVIGLPDLTHFRQMLGKRPGPSGMVPFCGNGYVEHMEECDDGNTEAGDGCSGVCLSEPAVVDSTTPAGPQS